MSHAERIAGDEAFLLLARLAKYADQKPPPSHVLAAVSGIPDRTVRSMIARAKAKVDSEGHIVSRDKKADGELVSSAGETLTPKAGNSKKLLKRKLESQDDEMAESPTGDKDLELDIFPGFSKIAAKSTSKVTVKKSVKGDHAAAERPARKKRAASRKGSMPSVPLRSPGSSSSDSEDGGTVRLIRSTNLQRPSSQSKAVDLKRVNKALNRHADSPETSSDVGEEEDSKSTSMRSSPTNSEADEGEVPKKTKAKDRTKV